MHAAVAVDPGPRQWPSAASGRARERDSAFFERPILNSPYGYPGRHWEPPRAFRDPAHQLPDIAPDPDAGRRLLARQIADVDGNVEDRRATISVFNGAAPVVRGLASPAEESVAVDRWVADRAAEGVAPGEMAVFGRSEAELPRAESAVQAAGLAASVLDEAVRTVRDRVPVATMHLGKGLEFRAVAVMACDDEIVPLGSRIEAAADRGDLEEVYDTERHLLYVACTRARDQLLVTGVAPASEFLQDLAG